MDHPRCRTVAAFSAACLLVVACSESDPVGDNSTTEPHAFNKPPQARAETLLDCGPVGQPVTIDASATTDEETPDELEYGIDWNGDGFIDTDWFSAPVFQVPLDPRLDSPLLWVRDPQDRYGSAELDLSLTMDLDSVDVHDYFELSSFHGSEYNSSPETFWFMLYGNLRITTPARDVMQHLRVQACWALDVASGDTLLYREAPDVWVYHGQEHRVNGITTIHLWVEAYSLGLPIDELVCERECAFGMKLTTDTCPVYRWVLTPNSMSTCNAPW